MLEGLRQTAVDIFPTEAGAVLRGLRRSDEDFTDFGEVYFSVIDEARINAWKMHSKMTMSLLVPVGKVLFWLIDDRKHSATFQEKQKVILSRSSYSRLIVPPGIWFGFRGLAMGESAVCNISDREHDPQEVLRKPQDAISVDWEDV